MKLILTGATGFAGGEVLKQALLDSEIEQVMVLTRRATRAAHPKLQEVKDQYVVITHDYAVAAAAAMIKANPRLRFCFVSGRSADPNEKASHCTRESRAARSAR